MTNNFSSEDLALILKNLYIRMNCKEHSMKHLLIFLFGGIFFLTSCNQAPAPGIEFPENPNFLLFFIDDLRPELGCYGHSQIHSPHIDQLAEGGLRFDKAYCNVPVCGASRASLMTGARPTPQRFLTYYTRADEDLPTQTTLPEFFKEKGYQTVSLGKIFHHGNDSQDSWSQPPWHAEPSRVSSWRDYITDAIVENFSSEDHEEPSTERAIDAHDTAYIDGKTATKAIRMLRQFSEKKEPFMLWVGFVKPHLPFNAPSRYWDLYDRDSIKLATYPFQPKNAPDQAMHNSGELRGYTDIPAEGPVSDEKAAELIHGYYACVSYTDALVGQVLEELKHLELDKNTIVALFGDHGWNLGEHGLWCKHCNFNTSLQVPLIIRIPGQENTKKQSIAGSTEGLVEFVDLYPTFVDLAGFEVPEYLSGKSLLPLIENPGMDWKDPVFARYGRGNSIIGKDEIYTEYIRSLKDTSVIAKMMYDHRSDPDETHNIVEEEAYHEKVHQMSLAMKKLYKSIPPNSSE